MLQMPQMIQTWKEVRAAQLTDCIEMPANRGWRSAVMDVGGRSGPNDCSWRSHLANIIVARPGFVATLEWRWQSVHQIEIVKHGNGVFDGGGATWHQRFGLSGVTAPATMHKGQSYHET